LLSSIDTHHRAEVRMDAASGRVDLHFRIAGREIPLDHGYLLYCAISHVVEQFDGSRFIHETKTLGLIAVRGIYAGNGKLRLERTARFGLRLPADQIANVLCLAGKRLDIGGHAVRVGPVQVRPLIPAAALRAFIVTTKNGDEEARFDAEVRRQLDELNINATPRRGDRKFTTIRGKKIIGHELLVSGLSAEESIRLQEHGVGGRRKMGCGVFLAYRGR